MIKNLTVRTFQPFYPEGFVSERFSHNTEPPTIPIQVLSAPERDKSLLKTQGDTVGPGVVPGSRSDLKSTAYATTKLAVDFVKESSDVFPPLKSVAGGLSAILDHCDVRFVSLQPDGS